MFVLIPGFLRMEYYAGVADALRSWLATCFCKLAPSICDLPCCSFTKMKFSLASLGAVAAFGVAASKAQCPDFTTYSQVGCTIYRLNTAIDVYLQNIEPAGQSFFWSAGVTLHEASSGMQNIQ